MRHAASLRAAPRVRGSCEPGGPPWDPSAHWTPVAHLLPRRLPPPPPSRPGSPRTFPGHPGGVGPGHGAAWVRTFLLNRKQWGVGCLQVQVTQVSTPEGQAVQGPAWGGGGCCRAVGAAWPGRVLRVVLTVSRHKPHTHAHTHALSHMCSHIHALSHTLAHISPGELFPAAAVRCGQEPGAASLTCMVSCDERYCSHSIFMPQKGSHHTEKA